MQGKVSRLFLSSKSSTFLSVRVLLHLGTTVWVERVQLMVRQPSISSYVAKFDSAQDLVNEGKMKNILVNVELMQDIVGTVCFGNCLAS